MNAKEMHHLWNLLSQTWGDRFSQQFGSMPNDAWSKALASISVQSAQHAYRKLVQVTPEFPPTLPQFMQAAVEFNRSAPALPRLEADQRRQATTEELRRNASPEVGAFNSYRDYESQRNANTKNGRRPPHPTPDSADWLYLQRLAWIEADENNRRATAHANPAKVA